MENQKIINLLNKDDNDSKHFATKKWYIINDENNTNYGVDKDTGANNPDTIKYDTRVLKPNLCDYAEAYILVDGTIRATNAVNNIRLALKNCPPFTKCNLEINDEHVDIAENLDIVMPMYNLIEYSDNYQDSSATLYQYKRDEPPEDDAVADLTADNSDSLKYKINLLGNVTEVVGDAAGVRRLNVKVVVPLKYLRNFFRSLQMPLINCKIKLNLTWKKNVCYQLVLVKQYLLIMIQNCMFQLLLCQKKIIKILLNNKIKHFKDLFIGMNIKQKNKMKMLMLICLIIPLDPSFQGVNRLFVMAYSRADNNQPTRYGQRKYYLPRIALNKYNVIIDGKKIYDNPIENNLERYRELKKVMTGKGEDYTTGSLLDFNYFLKHKLIAVDLSKQNELDADPRAIQQIEFKCMLESNSTIYWVLEKSKETTLEFYKGTVKVY